MNHEKFLCMQNEFIKIHDSLNNEHGYNINDPQKICLGKKCSQETKNNQSKRMLGINNPMYGKYRSDEFKRMVSEIHRGKQLSAETKRRISKSHCGLSPSPETKEKMKMSQVKRWDTIKIEVNWEKRRIFNSRASFVKFIREYNRGIPLGRVRGMGAKRINWKRALRGEYAFITIIQK